MNTGFDDHSSRAENNAVAPGSASVKRASQDRPRVLHVLTYYRPIFTGHGLFWEKLWLHLAGLGGEHDVLVVNTPCPGDDQRPAAESGRLTYLSHTPSQHKTRKILELNAWLLKHLRHYDVLHFHSHIDRYFISHWTAYVLGIPIVYSATLNDSLSVLSEQYRPLFRPYSRFMFKRLDYLIVNGAHLAEKTANTLPQNRVKLIPNGIQCAAPRVSRSSMRRRMGISNRALVLVSIGGLCERKAQHVLIENHRAISKDGSPRHLVLVGPAMEPTYAANLKTLAEERGIADRVHFAGYTDDTASYYAMSDIFVFSSTSEGFGNVIGEAMYMGLPVVSRYLPGTIEFFVRNGETGFWFTTEDEYRECVDELAELPALRSRISSQGQRWIEQEYSMSVAAEKYHAVYKQMAGGK